MELNKSDRNYLILILIILISVLSLKIKPVNFRLVLKAIVLLFLLYFISKRDLKVSLFLTLLLFALNQNGIGNSIDFFDNHEMTNEVLIRDNDKVPCYTNCYKDNSINMDDCENLCNDVCTLQCSSELTDDQTFSECSTICSLKEEQTTTEIQNSEQENTTGDRKIETPDLEIGSLEDLNKLDFNKLKENFANNNNSDELVSDERGCRIKCLDEGTPHNECKDLCSKKCVNTCTSSTRDFENCRNMCTQ
jgi:hypothetical protein